MEESGRGSITMELDRHAGTAQLLKELRIFLLRAHHDVLRLFDGFVADLISFYPDFFARFAAMAVCCLRDPAALCVGLFRLCFRLRNDLSGREARICCGLWARASCKNKRYKYGDSEQQ